MSNQAPRMEHAARTDVGQRREHNEDSIVAVPPLFAVADGVGGATAGERASQLAIETLAANASAVADAPDTDAALQAMASAVEAANAAVYGAQQAAPELAGMGTTMCALVVRGDGHELILGHVGDSRAYRIGPASGVIEQISSDHSVVAELLRTGQISADEARHHPHRNAITRALGTEPHVAVDVAHVELPDHAFMLLCSDGLTGHVEDAEIAAIVQSHASSPADAARELIELANGRGGTDNISVVIVAAPTAPGGPFPAEQSGQLRVLPIDKADTGSIPMLTDEQVAAFNETTSDAVEAQPLAPSDEAAVASAQENTPDDDRSAYGIRSWRRWLLFAALLLAVAVVAAFAWRQSYFLTVRSDGRVGIDQGFPIGGLSRQYRDGDVLASDLSKSDRKRIIDGDVLRSKGDALRMYLRLPILSGACDRAIDTTGVTPTDPTMAKLPDAACPNSGGGG